MGFELFIPKMGPRERLTPGLCSLDKNGALRVLTTELASVGITTKFVLLLDRATQRVALRNVCGDLEEAAARTVKPKKPVQTFNIGSALKELGLKPADRCGRREIMRKDNMLTINFMGHNKPSGAKK